MLLGPMSVSPGTETYVEGSVLSARSRSNYVTAIFQLHAILRFHLINYADGLESYLTEDEDLIPAVTFIGVELQQMLLAAPQLGIEIDAEIREKILASLRSLKSQLTDLRELHERDHGPSMPYQHDYFAFIEKHPLPDGEAA